MSKNVLVIDDESNMRHMLTTVLEKDEVYSGGGDSHTLLKLKVAELKKFGRVEDIHKEEDPAL